MNKQTESLTNKKMEPDTPSSKSQKHYGSQGTLNLMKETEALEWISRFNEKSYEHGPREAKLWWSRVILDLEKIRGKPAVDELRERMNRLRNTP